MGKLVGSGKYSSYSSRWLKHKTLLEVEKDVEQGFSCTHLLIPSPTIMSS